MSDLGYFAKQYASWGLAIFPVKQDKTPYTRNGFKAATTDQDQIEKWWRQWPSANIGMATGEPSHRIFVVDQDVKGAYNGIDSFKDWTEKNHLTFKRTWISKTASGGQHTFFTALDTISTRAGWLPGVDVRGDGGYVILPPSNIPGSGSYEWIVSPDEIEYPISEDDDVNVLFLTEKINHKNTAERFTMKSEVVTGERNETLYKLACSLQKKGLDDSSILAAVEAENDAKCVPPLSSAEVKKLVESALKQEKGSADHDSEFWKYSMAAWRAENPGKDFDQSGRPWNEVESAGQRAKEAGLNFDKTRQKDSVEDDADPDQDETSEDADLDRFHLKNEKGKITGAYDFEIHQYLKTQHHIFILGGIPYVYHDGLYHADLSGAKLKTMIRKLIYPQYVKSTTIKRIYDLFISDAELQRSFEDLNHYPAEWINFKNGFYDPISKQIIEHDPKYLAINQIPYEFDPAAAPEGETIRAWLEFIAPDPDDREMLLQYAGYCLTRDTRQQKFLILRGEGGSGKSTVINLIEQMIGPDNTSNVSLAQLTQRFAPFNLLGKLLNSCADLEVTSLEDVSMIKKILGEDSIAGEAKGKDLISFRSYAKLIFSTNELPTVRAERTNGFYRRLLILKMDRIPDTRSPDFFRQLSSEIDYFIHESVSAVCRMYESGYITESSGSREAVHQLRCDSDTVEAFLSEKIERVPEGRIKKLDLYHDYEDYCSDMDRQSLKKQNFYRTMNTRGFGEVRSGGVDFYKGIRLKTSLKIPLENPLEEWDYLEAEMNPFEKGKNGK